MECAGFVAREASFEMVNVYRLSAEGILDFSEAGGLRTHVTHIVGVAAYHIRDVGEFAVVGLLVEVSCEDGQ